MNAAARESCSGAKADTHNIYQAGKIKRHRRTRVQVEQLDRQIIEVLEEDNPQSVRHVFYRMTNPRLPEPVEKSDRGYSHVQHRCVELRRSGQVPYQWFADMTRHGYFVNTFSGSDDFIRQMSHRYRADLWKDAACRCEVWAESRSIASVLLAECTELAVDLYPCGGFSSLSFVHEAAEQNNSLGDSRPLVIFYIGDFDPAGVLIDKALERELRLHLDADIEMHFRRLAINEEQIAAYDLPVKPRKTGDKRSQHLTCSVEAEAMPAGILRSILRAEIERLLPPGALRVAQVAEQSERAYLMQMANIMHAGTQP